MDYRRRKYYLVAVDGYKYDENIRRIQEAAPSLKISSAYNHFPDGGHDSEYTRFFKDSTYWQMLVSCKHIECKKLEETLEELNKSIGNHYLKLNKEILGQ